MDGAPYYAIVDGIAQMVTTYVPAEPTSSEKLVIVGEVLIANVSVTCRLP